VSLPGRPNSHAVALVRYHPPVPEADLDTQFGDDPSLQSSSSPRVVTARPLERGEVVGRYLVLERLGVGGMGEVYAAYDAELDRKIAIKLLLPSKGDGSTTSGPAGRLQREAQAMAKLDHPNVVTVYDVGKHDIRVFVAMEYVDGGTLADWMDAGRDGHGRPHAWRLVIERFLAAGEGLAAAHTAGLIHRDFKPANVLVGRDGSIRVADFGLARRATREPGAEPPASAPVDDEPDSAGTSPNVALSKTLAPEDLYSLGLTSAGRATLSDSLSMRMTATGATLGTPAYMAPEQYGQGGDVDARADQFSFCVALWEALYGERPFGGDNLHVLMFAIAQANLREPPSNSDVPTWIRRVLVRGLARDPARRWPDMHALLTELRTDPSERRRKLGLIAGGLLLVGGLVGGLIATRPDAILQAPPCMGAAAAFGDALSPTRREAIGDRFATFEKQWAHDIGERLPAQLDAWALAWQAAWTDTCEDTHVRSEQSAELLDRRMLCLDRQRRSFIGIVDALGKADEALARRADKLLHELELAACSDSEALLRITALPDDPAKVAAIERADAVLSNARQLYLAGGYLPSQMLLASQRTDVAELDYAPLSATFEQLHGRLAMSLDDLSGGEQALERAFGLALQAGDDYRAIKITRSLAYELKEQDRNDESMRWLAIGMALANRLDDDRLRGELELGRSQALAGAGDFTAAEVSAQAAHDLFVRVHHDEAVIGDALYLLGLSSYRAGRYDETITRLEQARKAWAANIGPRHPRTQAALGLLGGTARAKGDYAQARAYFEEALAIAVGNHNEGHIQTTDAMMNFAVALADLGELDEAIRRVEEVLAIRRAQPEPVAIGIGRTQANLAQLQRKAGRIDEAWVNIRESEALIREALGPDHPDLSTFAYMRAMIEYERGELAQAQQDIAEALRIGELKYGADHPLLLEIHTDGAKIALARGQLDEAVRWLGKQPTADADPLWVGEYEFVQAQLHLKQKRKAEAVAAAARAKQLFVGVGPGAAKQLADVEAWLREHG
jgi:serine/threonine protein kinase/tetratricopeptide (TPR) repeat protein